MKYVRNSTSVTVFLDGKPFSFASSTPQYKLVVDAIASGNDDAVRTAADIRKTIVKQSEGLLAIDGSKVMFNGEELDGPIVERILHTMRVAGDLKPFANFLTLLMGNPDARAVRESFTFISKCNLPITEDGHILAFKKVRSDYTSIHDGKFMNKVGTTVFMPRSKVDPDANRTCSQGLHFCSRSYLSNFGSSGSSDRVLILKINPADVVAIPNDYNHAKGRAWRYEIVGELSHSDDGLLEDLTAWVATDSTQPGLKTSLKSGWDVLDEGEEDESDASIWEEDDADEEEEVLKTVATPTVQAVSPVVVQKQQKVGQNIIPDNVIRDIRRLLAEGFTMGSIARIHGISPRSVGRIRDGETYTDVV